MKKKLFCIFIVASLFLFGGCASSDKLELSDGTTQKKDFGESKDSASGILGSALEENSDPESDRFALIDCDYHVSGGTYAYILVDQKTRVQYLHYRNSFTLLVDADGKPLLYEGEVFYHAE